MNPFDTVTPEIVDSYTEEDLLNTPDESVSSKPFNESISSSRKEQDLALWHAWNSNKHPSTLIPLLKAMNGPIMTEVNRTSGSVPKHVLEAAGKKWAITAFERFNPKAGVALATHVTNYLAKVRRVNYKHQNMVRMPEEKTLQFSQYQEAVNHLTDTLNRPPTDDEVASHLEWKPTSVRKFKSMIWADHYESGSDKASEAHDFDHDKVKIEYLRETLDEQEKVIFDSLFLPDNKKLSSKALAAKVGVNENRLSYLKTKLKKKIGTFNKEMGA